MTPDELGTRDGKDAFLLDKKYKNPFKWRSMDNELYYYAWNEAYNEEFENSLNLEND